MTILDRINLGYIWGRTVIAEQKRWKKSKNGNTTPRVFNGLDEFSDSQQKVYGGQVKLLDLKRVFGNHRTDPNILYLVSSALPYFPVMMAQRAKKAAARLVVNQNGVAYPGWHGSGWEKANRSMTQLLKMADYVIYQSQFCKISADKYLGSCGHREFEILYNPVDTSFFVPGKEASTPTALKPILIAGSHWSAYRILAALETLSIVRKTVDNIFLRIAGRFCWREKESEAIEEVRKYAQRLKVDDGIELYGSYTQQEAPDLMRSCSLLLHTKYNDPCPRLVVEAMACGLPVVYSATGGVPELVGEEAGFGVPGPLDWEKDHPPDASQLAAGVIHVFGKLEKYSSAARKRAVENFDMKPWIERHAEIFQKIL